jgi:hypothetical protein
MEVDLLVHPRCARYRHPLRHRIAVQVVLQPVRSDVSGTITGTSPCRQSSMRPRSANLPNVGVPEVGLVLTGQVILQKPHHRQGAVLRRCRSTFTCLPRVPVTARPSTSMAPTRLSTRPSPACLRLRRGGPFRGSGLTIGQDEL